MHRTAVLLVTALQIAGFAGAQDESQKEVVVGAETDAELATRVLLVDLDDVGADLVARAHTPTLDRLTAEWRYFPTLVTSPSCSPSRAMLMTGAQSSHVGNLVGRVLRHSERLSEQHELPTDVLVMLPALVARSGKRTAKVGKWHLCEPQRLAHPIECGWQSYRGAMGNLVQEGQSFMDYPKALVTETDGEFELVKGRYLTSDETEDAIAAVREGVDLVSVSYHAPHGPWAVPPLELLSEATRPAEGEEPDTGELAALMLEACDHELARLLEAAEKQNYVVFVFGDNGSSSQAGGQAGGGKATFLDSGVVVPMWVGGPGVEPGVDASLVSIVDFYATVADLFGLQRNPVEEGPHSISFAPALRGEPHLRPWAVAELIGIPGKNPRARKKLRWTRMIRDERYKLIWHRHKTLNGPEISLFDLLEDPLEEQNLMDLEERPADAEAALERLLEALERV